MINIVARVADALPLPDPADLAAALAAPATQAEHDRFACRITALSAIEYRAPERIVTPRSRLRLVAWNAERLKYAGPSAALLRALDADVVLLSEADVGMARSGNRHTAADLAAALDMCHAYGVEFVELGLGDGREQTWHRGERNIVGFHGNAILSRLPLRDLRLVRLDDGGRWFNGRAGEQRRIGGRMAVAGRIATDDGDLVVVSVHLESDSDADDRAQQVTRLLAALGSQYGPARMVIGGDCNTAAFPAGGDPRLWADGCETYEPLFGILAEAGFGWREANDMATTQRMRPDGQPVPPFRRIDWLFARGLTASAARTIAAVDDKGGAISDHDAVVADLTIV